MNEHTSSTSQHTARPAIIRLPEVMQTVGLSRPSVYRMMKAGTFPQSVRLGARAVGWLRGEVEQWLANLSQARANSMPDPGRTLQHAAA